MSSGSPVSPHTTHPSRQSPARPGRRLHGRRPGRADKNQRVERPRAGWRGDLLALAENPGGRAARDGRLVEKFPGRRAPVERVVGNLLGRRAKCRRLERCDRGCRWDGEPLVGDEPDRRAADVPREGIAPDGRAAYPRPVRGSPGCRVQDHPVERGRNGWRRTSGGIPEFQVPAGATISIFSKPRCTGCGTLERRFKSFCTRCPTSRSRLESWRFARSGSASHPARWLTVQI